MTQAGRILIVDDETNIRLTLSALLRRAGFDVTSAERGQDAVALLEQQTFDVALIDLKMPGMDGMQVLDAAKSRQPDIEAIILTGHGSLETAIEAMHQRVFDYLLKTSEPATVVERVKAAMQARAQHIRQRTLLDVLGSTVQELRGSAAADDVDEGDRRQMIVGALQLDVWRQVATLGERTLPLTPTEFRVLLSLAEHAGTMVPYTQLVRAVHGYDVSESEAGELIKPHIHHLRQKLEPNPGAPRYILNVRGKGYLLSPVGE